jgi:purine nucleosidase
LAQAQVTAQDVLTATALPTTGAGLPSACSPVQPGDGVAALIDCVRRHPGRITLLAIGPLTNVATAFVRAPDLPALLAGLVVMGGSLGSGNITTVAEFNIFADPEAAAQVFAKAQGVQGVQGVSMFGLEVCRQIQADAGHVAALRQGLGARAQVFADHLDGYIELARRRGKPSAPMYDPTPVAWLAHPEWFTLLPAQVQVELQGQWTRGMTVCELRVPQRAAANAQVGMTAQGARVMEWAVALLREHLA